MTTAHQHCDGCGLQFASISPSDAEVAVRSFPRRYSAVLASAEEADAVVADDVVRRRPAPGVWSAIEYTAHVAAVLHLYEARIRTALSATDGEVPTFETVDPERLGAPGADERAVDDVLAELKAGADRLAATLDGIDADDWSRPGVRDGAEVDVLWLARQAVHEGSHHLRDAEQSLRAALGAS